MDHTDAGTWLVERAVELVLLEDDIMTACERAASRGARSRREADYPARWTRAAWRQYLAEAVRGNRALAARMRRLRRDIIQLERLADAHIPAALGALNRQDDEHQPASLSLT